MFLIRGKMQFQTGRNDLRLHDLQCFHILGVLHDGHGVRVASLVGVGSFLPTCPRNATNANVGAHVPKCRSLPRLGRDSASFQEFLQVRPAVADQAADLDVSKGYRLVGMTHTAKVDGLMPRSLAARAGSQFNNGDQAE